MRRMETSGMGEGKKFMGSCPKPRQNRSSKNSPLGWGGGLFALFWLGGKENVTGPTIFGSCAQDHVSSVGSIYPRQWGTGSQGLGFLKEKRSFSKRMQLGRH